MIQVWEMSGIIILINVFYYYSLINVIFLPLQTIFPGSNTSIIIIVIVVFIIYYFSQIL